MPVVPASPEAVHKPLVGTESPSSLIPQDFPNHNHKFPLPVLRLQLDDLVHSGSDKFLSSFRGGCDLSFLVQNVLNLLYTKDDERPGTRSVTLIIKAFNGVAYTSGISLDNDHKEICLSSDYICQIQSPNIRDEILGVICHELVHCFQWDAGGTCPGGLIEGLADWVRLRSGLAARHWKQDASGKWDQGYQGTAYFLEYLEGRFGDGTVRHINRCLNNGPFDRDTLFRECCRGHTVEKLWEEYGKDLETRNLE